jgi:hypothetical protein
MRIDFFSKSLFGLTLAACAVLGAPAFADTVSYKAELQGAQEVPPVPGDGKGSGDVTYDTATKQLTWKVTFSGLTGPATAAHFHGPAEPGKNAGVAVPIAGTASPLEGSATLTDAQVADLTGGKWYVNVHTATNKGGEIRGQVVKK